MIPIIIPGLLAMHGAAWWLAAASYWSDACRCLLPR